MCLDLYRILTADDLFGAADVVAVIKLVDAEGYSPFRKIARLPGLHYAPGTTVRSNRPETGLQGHEIMSRFVTAGIHVLVPRLGDQEGAFVEDVIAYIKTKYSLNVLPLTVLVHRRDFVAAGEWAEYRNSFYDSGTEDDDNEQRCLCAVFTKVTVPAQAPQENAACA
jgi:hypothetical protein